MKSPFRGWNEIPTDIEGVNPPPTYGGPPMHILAARYALFFGIVAFVVIPTAIPGLLLMAWRDRKFK